MEQPNNFSFSAAALSVFTAAAAYGSVDGNIRLLLLYSAGNTLLLMLILFLLTGSAALSGSSVFRGIAIFWLAAELLQTIVQAQAVAWQEFRSMSLIGLLPLLLWAGWKIVPAQWNTVARVLWWFVCFGVVLCIAGLAGQAQWMRLVALAPEPLAVQIRTPVYAEYLVVPFLNRASGTRRQCALPWFAFLAQAGAVIGKGMIFGTLDYPAVELLRGWSVGVFSRMDALLLLIWLMCAVFRIGFLSTAIRLMIPQAEKRRKKASE